MRTLTISDPGLVAPASASGYLAAVLADSPLAVWMMDETSGTTMTDASGNGRHGTYVGGVTLGSAGPAGLPAAASFDGVNDYAFAAIDLSSHSAVTIEFCLWVASWPATTQLVYEYGAISTTTQGFYGNAHDSSTWASATNSPGSATRLRRATRPSTSAWHFWSITHVRGDTYPDIRIDGAGANGSTYSSGSVPGNFANLTLYLMSRAGSGLFQPGRMAGLAIYSGALSDTRRDAHATAALT